MGKDRIIMQNETTKRILMKEVSGISWTQEAGKEERDVVTLVMKNGTNMKFRMERRVAKIVEEVVRKRAGLIVE